jgi:hypothetical protein
LDHEALDDAVEARILVVERFARCAFAFLAGTQCAEVLGGLGDNVAVLGRLLVACSNELECAGVGVWEVVEHTSSKATRPAFTPPMAMSKKTRGRSEVC